MDLKKSLELLPYDLTMEEIVNWMKLTHLFFFKIPLNLRVLLYILLYFKIINTCFQMYKPKELIISFSYVTMYANASNNTPSYTHVTLYVDLRSKSPPPLNLFFEI